MIAVGVGKCVVLLTTGTGDPDSTAITEALLQAATSRDKNSDGPKAEAKLSKEEEEPAGESSQSDSEEGEEGGNAGGKRVPSMKWEAVVDRERKARKGGGSTVGPRVVLRWVMVDDLSVMIVDRLGGAGLFGFVVIFSSVSYHALKVDNFTKLFCMKHRDRVLSAFCPPLC